MHAVTKLETVSLYIRTPLASFPEEIMDNTWVLYVSRPQRVEEEPVSSSPLPLPSLVLPLYADWIFSSPSSRFRVGVGSERDRVRTQDSPRLTGLGGTSWDLITVQKAETDLVFPFVSSRSRRFKYSRLASALFTSLPLFRTGRTSR